jgi:putative ABC transport system permease protein
MKPEKNKKSHPPRLPEWIICQLAWAEDRFAIQDNLREEYRYILDTKGRKAAYIWYWGHMLRSIFPFVKFSVYWSFVMVKNYLKTAYRNAIRHKGYAFINLAGLVIGLAASILIFLWVQDELGYDRFHKNGDRIHRVISNLWVQPVALAPALVDDYPEIQNAVRILKRRSLVNVGEKKYYEDTFTIADNSLFEIFTLPLVSGNPATALAEPFSLVMTEEAAVKYFGQTDPMGQIVKIDGQYDMKVTGVIENLPQNSTLQFSLIASFPTLKQLGVNMNDWGNHMYSTYILLDRNASVLEISNKITGVVQKNIPTLKIPKGLSLQAMPRIHLYEEGYIKNVTIFSSVAVFILLLAFINFINLTTARAENRSLEVGIRKVIGAKRTQLIRQFLGETILFAVAAFLLALVLGRLLLPIFNSLSAKKLDIGSAATIPMLLGFLGITILASLAAGSYPAFFLSSFHPSHVIRKIGRTGKMRSSRLRQLLVIFQFSLSIFLIILTIVVYNQLHFIRKKEVGFEKEHVVYLGINRDILQKRDPFQDRLRQISNIRGVTMASSVPSNVTNTASGIDWEGNDGRKNASWRFAAVDYDYFQTLDLEIVAGRSFSRDYPSDVRGGFIVNEEAVKEMGLEDPVGKWFSLWGNKGTIIGVVKNFHFRSLHTPIAPLLLWMGRASPGFFEYTLVRIAPGQIPETIKAIQDTWKIFSPNFPFEYGFLDDTFGRLYQTETRMGMIFSYFTFLAIFISCLGLFGLAAYSAEMRTKEVGIRKVFGATTSGIAFMMSGAYSRWILAANLIAWPIAYFFANKWLQGFAYRTSLTLFTFVLAAILSSAVALLTVSYQSIKAATANPIDSLRYE